MNTKYFTFPTFGDWFVTNFNNRLPEIKDGFKIPTNMLRWYALDFLSSLADFVNEGENLTEWNWILVYTKDFEDWIVQEADLCAKCGGIPGYWFISPLFFYRREKVIAFRDYEGCGTTTKEQLNILYNIDQ